MEQMLHHLRPVSTLRVMRKGTNLLFQGEVPRRGFFIRDGIVRSYMITSAGEERTLGLFGKNELLPLPWLLGISSHTLFYYEALSDTRVLSFTRDNLMAILDEQPAAARELVGSLGSDYTALLLRVAGLEQSRAIDKIGFTLYYLMFRFGKSSDGEQFMIDVKLSQSMLASLVGLTRESTAKNLMLFKEKGVIRYESSVYTVYKLRLENFLGEDAFRELSL
jgi:CRP/FNR family cyclic AMP-dependent transcriptional regulator